MRPVHLCTQRRCRANAPGQLLLLTCLTASSCKDEQLTARPAGLAASQHAVVVGAASVAALQASVRLFSHRRGQVACGHAMHGGWLAWREAIRHAVGKAAVAMHAVGTEAKRVAVPRRGAAGQRGLQRQAAHAGHACQGMLPSVKHCKGGQGWGKMSSRKQG